ncbi:MAG: hypothetical protein R3264_09135 [Anaerolineae bacterium]|nr:hypothetical protein [Anaerolineae bacterium]
MLSKLLRPWTVTLVVALLYLGWILSVNEGNPRVFVEIGSRFANGIQKIGTTGYDAQFFYFLAADPMTASDKIDVPAYRIQRILFPALVRLFSFGQTRLIPWAMLAINLIGLGAAVFLMEKLLLSQRINRWHALPVGLYGGQLLSLRVDLPEPLALAFVLWGLWLFEQERHGWWLSALAFSLAVFTKETMVITGLAYGLYLLTQRQIVRALIFGIILVIPFLLFQLFLYAWLQSFGVGSGGAGATPFELIPFGGLFRVAEVSWMVFGMLSIILGPIVVFPTLWAIYATGHEILQHNWHPWTFALLLNALIIVFIPHSTFREPLAMLRFTIPFVALTILFAAYKKQWRPLNYSYLWLITIIFVFQDPRFWG